MTGVIILAGSSADPTPVPVTPRKLIVIDKPAKARTVFVAKDSTVTKGPGVDVGQISVQVTIAQGSAVGAFTIPTGTANGWRANTARGARYVNPSAPGGPTQARLAVIKPGKLLKLAGEGMGDLPLDIRGGGEHTGPVSTSYCVTNGGEQTCHCSEFTGCAWKPVAKGTGAKLVCKHGSGDAGCGVCSAVTLCRDGDGCCPAGCGRGTDADCASCFVDLGLTVLDTCTNLEWEKKDEAGDSENLHEVSNRYSWAGWCSNDARVPCQPNAAAAALCAQQTGNAPPCAECADGGAACNVDPEGFGAITTVWDWVAQVNEAKFAGHSDWRLPTVAAEAYGIDDPPELQTLLLGWPTPSCPGDGFPCTDPALGPILSDSVRAFTYWSGSLNAPAYPADYPMDALSIAFASGSITDGLGIHFPLPVRAVRGGP